MVKKRKSNSAQDLIDSLLDEQGDDSLRAASDESPSAPPLPPAASAFEEKSFVKTIVFEMNAEKADPTRLGIVGDRSHIMALKNPKSAAPPVMNTDEIRRAPTAIMVSYDAKEGGDKTIRLPAMSKTTAPIIESQPRFDRPDFERQIPMPKVDPRFQPASQMPLSTTEASLKQSESLRVAQTRILDLEGELDRLRRENEKLASAGETLRRRTDELLSKNESQEGQSRESQKIAEGERRVMQDQLNRKERENMEMRSKLEEAETRLEANFKKIRVRERELEHRLEIVKMESQTLVSTKDDMIMRLKREIDQMRFEIENSKVRSQELFNQYKEKQETIRRVVRALRIALTTLEGDEEKPSLKKAE